MIVEAKAKECECTIERRVFERLPRRYRRADLTDFPREVDRAALRWLGNPGDGLLISGPVGTGKTYLAAAIVAAQLRARIDSHFFRCSELYSDLRESLRANASEEYVLRRYVEPRYVALDDLGAGGLTDHERRVTLEVLDRRINGGHPTIITTNWSLEQIAERMDERIASRLASFDQLALDGPDRRAQR